MASVGGKIGELSMRETSAQSLEGGIAWSEAKLLSVVGLAGGLVTASDLLAHNVLKLQRNPGTTLALDLTMGAAMAGVVSAPASQGPALPRRQRHRP